MYHIGQTLQKPGLRDVSMATGFKKHKLKVHDGTYSFKDLHPQDREYLANDVISLFNIHLAMSMGMLEPTDTVNTLSNGAVTFRGQIAKDLKLLGLGQCDAAYEQLVPLNKLLGHDERAYDVGSGSGNTCVK